MRNSMKMIIKWVVAFVNKKLNKIEAAQVRLTKINTDSNEWNYTQMGLMCSYSVDIAHLLIFNSWKDLEAHQEQRKAHSRQDWKQQSC